MLTKMGCARKISKASKAAVKMLLCRRIAVCFIISAVKQGGQSRDTQSVISHFMTVF